jgi:Family of unknown function (DUF5996)
MTVTARGAAPAAGWKQLPWHDWADTIATVHMWTQIVGKIRMAQVPPMNHWWHVPLYVSARGLTTNAMPIDDRVFEIELDFVDHRVTATDSRGQAFALDLRPMSVAAFCRALMDGLAGMDIVVPIRPVPNEVAVAIPFADDEVHASYDRDHVTALFEGLSRAQRVMATFRGRFVGKASPVHFFWGSFDLAASRFSGAPAPKHPGGVPNCPDWVMVEAYNQEESSAGWWPSNPDMGPVFYSYTYPQPEGLPKVSVLPHRASYDDTFGEFILREEDLAGLADPESTILEFLQNSYEAGANLAGWDRAALEADPPAGGRVRAPWSRRRTG